MIRRSWKIISIILLVTPILSFPNLIFQLLFIITPLILDQLTCSLPKNVTTFHRQQEGIIHFCLSPQKCLRNGVLAHCIIFFPKRWWTFPNSIVQLLPIRTPLLLDQFKCSLPKNVTTFHGQKDGINHFCLTPNKKGVLAL